MSQQPEKSVAQVLRDAAAIVGKGWCQGEYIGDGECCLVGAIFCAERGVEPLHQHYDGDGMDSVERGEAVRLIDMAIGGVATNWNDAPERTQAEVIAKLLEAADLAEQEASHVTA